MSTNNKKLWIATNFLCIYLLWGSSFLANKIILQELPPFFTACLRFLLGGLLFHLLHLWEKYTNKKRNIDEFKIDNIQFSKIILTGLLLFGIGSGFLILGQLGVSTSEASLWMALIPIFMLIVDYPFFRGNKPNFLDLISVLLGFIGIYFVSKGNYKASSSHFYSILLALSALSWSIGSLMQKSFSHKISSFYICKWQMFFGSIGLICLSLFYQEYKVINLNNVSLKSWYFIFHLGFFSSVLAYGSFFQLMKIVDAQKVATYAYINPVVAIFLGHIFLGEEIYIQIFIGAILVLFSVFLILNNPARIRKKLADSIN